MAKTKQAKKSKPKNRRSDKDGRVSGERARLAAQLRNVGMFIKQSGDDGNCLFRSFADQLFGDEGLHGEVRERCIECMLANEERFGVYCIDEDETSYTDYCANMREDGTWGGQVECMAICYAYQTHCIVHQVADTNGECRTYEMRYNADPTREGRTVMVSYEGNEHYNSVRMLDMPDGAVHLTLRDIDRQETKKSEPAEPRTRTRGKAETVTTPRKGSVSQEVTVAVEDRKEKCEEKMTKAEKRKQKLANQMKKEQEQRERKRQKDKEKAMECETPLLKVVVV